MRGSKATGRILPESLRCALHEDCIAPRGSGRENHNYDQSALSIQVYSQGYACEGRREYAEGYMYRLTLDETRRNDVVFGVRRWQLPGPYPRHVNLKETSCGIELPYEPSDQGTIENYQAAHIASDSPLYKCLAQHNNSRVACGSLREEHVKRGTHSGSLDWHARGVVVGTWLYKLTLCPSLPRVAGALVLLALATVVWRVERTRRRVG